jgi:phage gp29-like protein
LEKFGTPKLVGKLPRALMDTEERNILLHTLVDMVQDACGVIPDDGSVEAMEANVTASNDVYERFAAYQNSEISTAILGHSAGATATPGRLGGEDLAAQVRADLVENDANMVTDTINTLIRYIHELNPSLGTERPNFLLYDERDIDEKRAARDAQLLNTGKISLTKKYFVDKYGFGEDEIEVIEPINADNARNYQTGLVTPEFSAATPSSVNLTSPNQSQDAVDIMASDGLPDEKLQTQAENLLKPVLELVETVDSFDDITRGLNKLYNNIDVGDVQATLEKAVLLSATWGRANA